MAASNIILIVGSILVLILTTLFFIFYILDNLRVKTKRKRSAKDIILAYAPLGKPKRAIWVIEDYRTKGEDLWRYVDGREEREILIPRILLTDLPRYQEYDIANSTKYDVVKADAYYRKILMSGEYHAIAPSVMERIERENPKLAVHIEQENKANEYVEETDSAMNRNHKMEEELLRASAEARATELGKPDLFDTYLSMKSREMALERQRQIKEERPA